jgi:peptidoglycan/LPS O-acetylase OafA/YrhL
MKLISNIQGLRGIAALLVVFAHLYGVDQKFFGGAVLSPAIQVGFSGVDLFFVISGFIMIYITQTGIGNLKIAPAFLFARFSRIYPLWWLVLGIIAAVWSIKPSWVFSSISGAPNLWADFLLLPHNRLPLLAVGWTLIHEVYFYIVFSALLLVPRKYFDLSLLTWMGLVAMGNALLPANQSPLLALITSPLTIEFGVGMLIGKMYVNRLKISPTLLLALGFVWLITAYLTITNVREFFEAPWSRVLAFAPAWGLICLGAINLELSKGLKLPALLIGLGNISYALYLIHVPILAGVSRLISPYCSDAAWDNVVMWFVLVLIACLSASLLHRLFELPTLSFLSKIRWQLFPKGSEILGDSRTTDAIEHKN